MNLDHFPKPPAWTALAACAEVDPELFFPEKGGRTTQAMSVCRSCRVQVECLDYALEHRDDIGFYAGTTPRQRRAMRRAA
jgi:WhiB family redox-sensing transcriptional regulator